jgi:hypothetical protein
LQLLYAAKLFQPTIEEMLKASVSPSLLIINIRGKYYFDYSNSLLKQAVQQVQKETYADADRHKVCPYEGTYFAILAAPK